MVIYVFEIDEGKMDRGQANKSDAQSIYKGHCNRYWQQLPYKQGHFFGGTHNFTGFLNI